MLANTKLFAWPWLKNTYVPPDKNLKVMHFIFMGMSSRQFSLFTGYIPVQWILIIHSNILPTVSDESKFIILKFQIQRTETSSFKQLWNIKSWQLKYNIWENRQDRDPNISPTLWRTMLCVVMANCPSSLRLGFSQTLMSLPAKLAMSMSQEMGILQNQNSLAAISYLCNKSVSVLWSMRSLNCP